MSVGPGTLVGPYRLERLLGRGGMAVVYEATQESIGRTVALKLVSEDLSDPGFLERFRNEGRMQAALAHPHVVTVYEAGTSEYGPFLAMRLIRGTTLAGLIDDGALTVERTLNLVGQVADALDAANAAGLVHRDVKPRNILVDGDSAYLADFGLTKVGGATGVTATGHFMGTLAYIAPEIVQGGAASAASDRYALAAVLFECLTGTVVFPRESQAAVLFAHTNEPVPLTSRRREGLPPALDDVLTDGLAKDPADRPATAADLIARARAALGGTELGPPVPRAPVDDDAASTSAAPVIATPARRAPRKRRDRVGLAVAALAGAAVAAVAVLLIDGDDKPAPAPPALPAAPAGTEPLGSSLAAAGDLIDCRGEAVTDRSPSCTIFQDTLTDATLVVPRRGVVRRWAVRSASGELSLAVLRPRDDGYFQVARSRSEFASNLGVSTFDVSIAVEPGDRLALVSIDGSGFGLRSGSGTTERWIPSFSNTKDLPAAGPAGELLLHVDYEPDGRPDTPARLLGDEAAAAPDGAIIHGEVVGLGTDTEVQLVMIDGHGALDLFMEGERVSRIDVPDMVEPLASGVVLDVEVAATEPPELDIDVEFSRPDSARIHHHFFNAIGQRLVFVD